MRDLTWRVAACLFAAAGAAACATTGTSSGGIVQPGAPGEASKVVGAEQARDLSKVGATPADVKFMQGMIHHHAQAIDMTELLKTRSASEDMKKLGLRIQVSQRDEVKMMQNWLKAHGQEAPDPHAMHMPGMVMPGMDHGPMMAGMPPRGMAHLAGLRGVAFDRDFLEGMIKLRRRHHQVKELFASPGAAQDSSITPASDVVADHR